MKKYIPLLLGLFTLLLLCVSILLQVVYPDPTVVYAAWGVTALLALAWAYEFRSSLFGFFTRKSTRYGANVGFIVLLVLGCLIFLNVIGNQYSWRKDITSSSVNSLSPQTIKILGDLKQNVKLYYFSGLQDKERGEPVFKNFAHESKFIAYEFVDTARRPTFVQTMDIKKNETALFVLEGTNKKVIVEGVTEEKLTNGLISLLRAKEQVLYFTAGHGERGLGAADPLGYGTLKSELEKQGYTVKELNLFSEGKIPADASVVVVAGPTSAFFPKELEVLSAWMKQGGRPLFAVDLNPADNGLAKGSRQIADLLVPYGVLVENEMLVDPTSRAANVEPQVLLGFNASRTHAITKDFPYSAVAANFLFPLTTYMTAPGAQGYSAIPLALTSENAWAEGDWGSLKSGSVTFDAARDKKGRMALAVAIETEKTESAPGSAPADPATSRPERAVVFGTSSFAANTLIDKVGNRDLFLNAVAWLAGDDQLISIRAKENAPALKNFNNSVLNAVLIITVFIMPLLILVMGIVIWVRRSKL